MQVTIDINDEAIRGLVRQRMAELLSDDARYRQTSVRDYIRQLVDRRAKGAVDAAVKLVMLGDLDGLAMEAIKFAMLEEIRSKSKAAARRLLKGDVVERLSGAGDEQRKWLAGALADALCEQQNGGKK